MKGTGIDGIFVLNGVEVGEITSIEFGKIKNEKETRKGEKTMNKNTYLEVAEKLDEKAANKEVEIERLQEQVKELKKSAQDHREKAIKAERKEDIFDIKNGDKVYFVNDNLLVIYTKFNEAIPVHRDMLKKGALSKSKEYTKLRAKKIELSNKLEQFSWKHGGKDIIWGNTEDEKWSIDYDTDEPTFEFLNETCFKTQGATYFISQEVALQAFEKFEPLFEEVRVLEEKLRGE